MTVARLIPIGAALREARLKKGLSVEEIAAGINLNAKFLDQIEQGIAPPLPEPYIKGILQSFAARVGLDLDTIPDAEAAPAQPDPQRPAVTPSEPRYVPEPNKESPAPKPVLPGRGSPDDAARAEARGYQRLIVAGFALLTIVSLGISIIWMNHENSSKPVQEISFPEAVKEQEAKYAAETHRADSLARSQDAAVQLARGDSLTLEGRAIDSVTVTVAVDHAPPRVFVIPPLRSAQWTAEKSFVISVGNPSALELSLNGVRLAAVSKSAKPVRGLVLNRSTIEKFQAKKD